MRKKGFTLIELMISVTLIILVAGAGIIYINNFNSREKIDASKETLISSIRLAREFAITKQILNRSEDDLELKYVLVKLYTDGKMEAIPYIYQEGGEVVEGDEKKYFDKKSVEPGIVVSTSPASNPIEIMFNAGSGKLMKDTSGKNFFDPSESINIVITSSEGVSNTQQIIIKSTGLINEKVN